MNNISQLFSINVQTEREQLRSIWTRHQANDQRTSCEWYWQVDYGDIRVWLIGRRHELRDKGSRLDSNSAKPAFKHDRHCETSRFLFSLGGCKRASFRRANRKTTALNVYVLCGPRPSGCQNDSKRKNKQFCVELCVEEIRFNKNQFVSHIVNFQRF